MLIFLKGYILMKKKAYIIHGWGEGPNEAWLVWLGGELEKFGWEVDISEGATTFLNYRVH
jgi:hypothetical protein